MATASVLTEHGAGLGFAQLLDRTHGIGRDVVQPAAGDVDSRARFPREGIDALRDQQLLSAYVPVELGGLGLTMTEVAQLCEALGQYCASTAMVFAMHQIQVACIVNHARSSEYFRDYLRELAANQWLIASATTELGVGGDVRTSVCALETDGDRFRLEKKAPVISYGEFADQILVTCRRAPDAAPSDQVHVLANTRDCQLQPMSGWDTLGFRGTCSSGFTLAATGSTEQVLPAPFAEILAQTMHPVSHIVWASLWLGIATDAVSRARAFVRAEARKTPNVPPASSLRLAELDLVLHGMRNDVHAAVTEYQRLLDEGNGDAFSSFGFAIRTNNLKLASSQAVVDIVGRAMVICGISAYRNDSSYALGRHLRDAYGAALMVNNDRIMHHNATMLLAHRES
jgi:acyl-CoA dehydrogenase